MDESNLKNFVENIEDPHKKTSTDGKIEGTDSIPKPWNKSQEHISLSNQIGWSKIPMEDLPTLGLFYPKDSEIGIRAASAGEIRHWSTINEDDLSQLDDMLNYILERCAYIKFPGNSSSSWKDLKEVDRFYILLAIREKTFVNGENQLQVKISETQKATVTKEMIQYISFDERIMKYYDDEKRCIKLKFKNGRELDINLPSVGLTGWLKSYITRKQKMQEAIDQDFLNFAPFIISEWRGLTDFTYEKYIHDSHKWSPAEISMLAEIKKIFSEAINPVIKYEDEQGGQRVIPLNFHGGIKSIFLISDPFSQLA